MAVFALVSCGNDKESSTESKSNGTKDTVSAEVVLQPEVPYSAVAMATPDLKESLEFWSKLGFEIIDSASVPYPYAFVSDGSLLIGLHQDGESYIGFTIWDEAGSACASSYVDGGFLMDAEMPEASMNVVITPDSLVGIAVIGHECPFEPLTRKTMKHFGMADYQNASAFPNPILGVFGEFSIPVSDLDAAINMWKRAGFEQFLREEYEGKEYAILVEQDLILGLHKEAFFKEAALTYFSLDTKQKAEALMANGVNEIKDLTDFMPEGGDRNFIITTPEGKKLFLFSLM